MNSTKRHMLTFSFQSSEDKDEIVVEIGELIELLEFLVKQLRTMLFTKSDETL